MDGPARGRLGSAARLAQLEELIAEQQQLRKALDALEGLLGAERGRATAPPTKETSAARPAKRAPARAAASDAECGRLADETRAARAERAAAENAQVAAAAAFVAAIHDTPEVDKMIAPALDVGRQRAMHLVELLRGTLLAGGAHRRVRDALDAFREARPGRDVGVAALAGVGEEDHSEQTGRDVEATLAALLGDVFG